MIKLLTRPFRACFRAPKVEETRAVSFLVMLPGPIAKEALAPLKATTTAPSVTTNTAIARTTKTPTQATTTFETASVAVSQSQPQEQPEEIRDENQEAEPDVAPATSNDSSTKASTRHSRSISFFEPAPPSFQLPSIKPKVSELTRLLKEIENQDAHPDTPTTADHGSPVKTRPAAPTPSTTKPLKSILKKTSSVGASAASTGEPKKKVRFLESSVKEGALKVEMVVYDVTPEASPVKESPGIKKTGSPWRGGRRAATMRCLEESLEQTEVQFIDLDQMCAEDKASFGSDVTNLAQFFLGCH